MAQVRSYRLLALPLASVFLLMSAGPLVLHLCKDFHAEAMGVHQSDHRTDLDARNGCDSHESSDASSPAEPSMLCCTFTATPLSELAALTPAKASSIEVAMAAALVSETVVPSTPQDSRPVPIDNGPPGPSVRPHLAFSVLLI